MSDSSSKAIESLVQQASKLAQVGKPKQALSMIQPLLENHPDNSQLLHLTGYLSLHNGEPRRAIELLTRSLQCMPGQIEVLNNLANAYRMVGDLEQSLAISRRLLEHSPNYAPAYKTLVLGLLKASKYRDVVTLIEKAGKTIASDPELIKILGDAYRALENYSRAAECYNLALVKRPNYAGASNNLALVEKALGRIDEAISRLEELKISQPNSAEVAYNLATSYFERGNIDAAENLLKGIIHDHSFYLPAHESLSELFWQTDRKDRYVDSYNDVIAREREVPDSFKLALAKQHTKICNLDAAEDLVGLISNQAFTSPKNQILAEISMQRGLYSTAINYLLTAGAAQEPFSESSVDLLTVYMKSGHTDAAAQLLERLLKWRPNNQYLWAIQGTLWKLLDDDRYGWLMDCSRFVSAGLIGCPSGYTSVNSFLSELGQYLCDLHVTSHEPMGQTLVGGTQTPGRLFKNPHPLIASLVDLITEKVQNYINELPDDIGHPLLSRKESNFSFSGSWSVLLRGGGYHVSHVHPLGWLSSSFYVQVPQNLPSRQGWIGFGRSSFGLGDKDALSLAIKPEPGLLVLFPSYMWHETVPMNTEQSNLMRITTPFDVVPGVNQ